VPVLSSETVKSVIVTLSGRRRCVSAPGGWLAGNAGADLVNLSQPSIPIGIGFKRRQRTTLNILPDPVRLALPVTPPPRRPFDLEYDAASPETVQAARAGACFERKYSSVQYNTIQCSNSNLTRGGAHAHAPLVVGRQPCDRQMTSKLFRPILAVNHHSKGLANVLAALAGHWAVVLVFLSRIPGRQKASISVFVSGEVGLSWPVA
jgi:hypothetical protein